VPIYFMGLIINQLYWFLCRLLLFPLCIINWLSCPCSALFPVLFCFRSALLLDRVGVAFVLILFTILCLFITFEIKVIYQIHHCFARNSPDNVGIVSKKKSNKTELPYRRNFCNVKLSHITFTGKFIYSKT
jgi:Na+-transporting methylmalonyl-CoA/oxaloacetate decarboxylase gamma subunit